MGRIRNSVELVSASWTVLQHDRQLFALPVLSATASLVLVASLTLPVVVAFGFGRDPVALGILGYGGLVLASLGSALVSIFFNSALILAADERMSGGDPTVGSSLKGAARRIHRILPWALVSATVSRVMQALQQRTGLLGAVLGLFSGLAWSAVTFLVLPVLVIEDLSPIDAVKRSVGLLRQAWGEGLVGNIGMRLVGVLAAIPFVLLAVCALIVGQPLFSIPLLAISVLGLITLAVVFSALSAVYQTAVYRFATNQPVPAFSHHVLQSAFRPR